MSDNENGFSASVSSLSSRRTSEDSLEESVRKILSSGDGRIGGLLERYTVSQVDLKF